MQTGESNQGSYNMRPILRSAVLMVGILTAIVVLTSYVHVHAAISDLIFADDFESGDFSAWTSSATNGGNLSVSPSAASVGSFGLQALINNTIPMYVLDTSPNAEPRYRARFYFDPNSITMATGNYIYILSGRDTSNTVILQIQFSRSSVGYQLRVRAYDSGLANYVNTPFVTISDGVHFVELDWGNDGHLTFWVDGVQQGSLTGLNNSSYTMDSVRLGATYISSTGLSGTYYIDAFESRQLTYIGPITGLPTTTPSPTSFGTSTPTPTRTPTRTPVPTFTPISAGSIRFAAIGDYGKDGPAEAAVANLVKSWNPNFIITTGDNNYPSGEATTIDQNIGQYYHEFIFPYVGSYGAGAASNRFFPSLGNHDWDTGNILAYEDYFTLPGNERYYDFVWGPVHFFIIDSDSHEPDGNLSTSIQAAWLQTQLTTSTSPWNLVYFHHPPYSSGQEHGSMTEMQWPFQGWGADVVLSGHNHNYERVILNGFPYFVVGLGGANLHAFTTPVPGSEVRYNSDNGALLVEAGSSYMTFQLITITGAIIDTYTLGTASTATPTSTETTTPTKTSTPTPAPTSTYTGTPTDAATPTQTFTPTFTSTPTDTGTPSQTSTPTTTPSQTFTPTDTATPTQTFTPASTSTPTETRTSTLTPTSTLTSTATPTKTATSTPTLTPTLTSSPTAGADLIFADGFESGNLAAWSSSTIDAGDLSVSTAAALTGGYGLQAMIDDNNVIYVTDDRPNAESRYRARFYFDPNSIVMNSKDSHYLFYGYTGASTVVLRVQFRLLNGSYQLNAGLRNDSNTWASTTWFTISDASHSIEIDWRAATASGANNGSLALWIDGAQRANLTGVDNDTRRIDRIRLGAVSGIDNSTRGTYYFDTFASHRETYIGP
jgi:tartrate-resistant acid phosphatase type 5